MTYLLVNDFFNRETSALNSKNKKMQWSIQIESHIKFVLHYFGLTNFNNQMYLKFYAYISVNDDLGKSGCIVRYEVQSNLKKHLLSYQNLLFSRFSYYSNKRKTQTYFMIKTRKLQTFITKLNNCTRPQSNTISIILSSYLFSLNP